MRVLVSCAHYAPGFRAGGPIRSIENLVAHLGDEHEFSILTADRDFGADAPFPDVPINVWTPRGKASIFYASPENRTPSAFHRIAKEAIPEVVYLNSFFHPAATQVPLRLRRSGKLGKVPFILAPRGEFAKGALQIKSAKKRVYRAVANLAGLYRDLLWQASSEWEAEEILRETGAPQRDVIVAPDLLPTFSETPLPEKTKQAGALCVLLVGRVSRMKNIDFALQTLNQAKGKVQFEIVGPLEDAEYLADCRRVAESLPSNVEVRFLGPVAPSELAAHYRAAHLLLQPSLGENFGHVIPEALAAGCPVLISDRTPWRGLGNEQIGWDLSLEDIQPFRNAIQSVLNMDQSAFSDLSRRARRYAERVLQDPAAVEANRRLFASALQRSR